MLINLNKFKISHVVCVTYLMITINSVVKQRFYRLNIFTNRIQNIISSFGTYNLHTLNYLFKNFPKFFK